ncbi:phosphoribosylformylglycinamidine cyclo-ligase [Micrococcus sp. EYE_162]|uniref:phosphoribosylformylglycinamidine cyclo-ligase n=1 Tax=unclassified Micrococcus TaxID=2620948 RepID=UPI002004BB31|nr:phosphoribosylformylglycinamidine cyclo-ligase [Micrococcus sp. EYE_212]MCK6171359.1 phosphoribosylformylglycinamidine cyclo-ligase [Micrococcus sp. EYE_162]
MTDAQNPATPAQDDAPLTYAAAGVDVEAGDRAVELMKDAVKATHTREVLGGVGGFAGMWDASALTSYRRPLLATSTDGVGTKVAIAQALDKHDTIGQDLVGMVVDDIVVVGATPLFMTDYIACGKVVPERIAAIVRGIAEGCRLAGTALVGGETAEHPGLLGVDEYDVAGAATGVVEADMVLGPERVQSGDVVIAMASSGIHSNGYSLVRRVVNAAGWQLDREVSELGRTLGEELLEPTRIYTRACLDLVTRLNGHDGGADLPVRAFSHVTGGGLAANLARVLPQGLMATVERDTWALPPVFRLVGELGRVPQADLERTLNLGVGMVAVVDEEVASKAISALLDAGIDAWEMGRIGRITDEAQAAGEDYVQGAKGVDGGAVLMRGAYAG